MNRRQIEAKRRKECARVGEGFAAGVCFSEGLVVGLEAGIGLNDQGSKGTIIPWGGNEHVKILISRD